MQEVCLNLAMPLGIGAGVLVLAIGILSILFFKCYIVVISSYLLTVQYISASSSIYSATSWYCKTFLSSHIQVTISILLFKCYIVVRPSYLLAYRCHYSWVLTRLHGKKGNEAISGDSEILRGLVHYSTRISSCFSDLLVVYNELIIVHSISDSLLHFIFFLTV